MMRHVYLLLIAASFGTAQEPATLVTSDIENFWRAVDASQPGNRRDAIQRYYFDAGSAGLRDFIRLRIGDASTLAAAIDALPEFYGTIRENTRKVESQRELIQLYLSRLRGLYPDAVFPSVYFLIGRVSTGGTFAPSGLLIGTEVFSLGPGVDDSTLQARSPAFYRAMGTIEKLPLVVIHESVHAQQRYRGSTSLISQSLIEGAADYFTNLVSGRTINDYMSQYAEKRRTEIFRQFAEDHTRDPKNYSRWLYNYGSVTGDTPADLGYWIGAEICRDYFTRAPEKDSAIRELMTMTNPEAIVRGSSYAWVLSYRPE